MKRITLLLLLTIFIGFSAAAQKRITGKVISHEDNMPLPGASVIIKGTMKGTTTDRDGEFEYTIENPSKNTVLVVSFVGMETKYVKVTDKKSRYVVYLDETASQLDEIVVTSSYGTRKLKEEVVGSITTVRSSDIQTNQAVESVDKILDGQLAGVNIESGTGAMEPVKIDIRGQGSLTQTTGNLTSTSTQPLIIVDNVIMGEESGIDNVLFDGGGTYAEDFQNPLAQIDPEDIASINVLKDAAAVSIYGADGANGVIIITTKKGQKGKMNINFSSNIGISKAINRIEYLNGKQYNDLRNEYLKNTGQETVPYNGVNTDWFDLTNQNGLYSKYNLNVSGGKKKFTYRIGGNYTRFKEAQKGNESNQYRFSSSVGYGSDLIEFGFSLNPSYSIKNSPNIYSSYAFVPTLPVYNDDGTYADVGMIGLGNPLAGIEQNLNKTNTFGLLSSTDLRINLTKNWYIFTAFGLEYRDKTQDRYYSGENESGQYNGTFIYQGVEYPKWGRRVIYDRNSRRWNWQGQTSYSKQFNVNHYFDVLMGGELAASKTEYERAMGTGFTNPEELNAVSDAIQDDDPETEKDETYANQSYNDDRSNDSRVSAFAQINYNFRKKYFILANFRRDQSSNFGEDSDVAYNGGIGLSWNVTKEKFLSEVNWLTFLKLRVSYGTTGNSRIGSYRSKGLYSYRENTGYNGLSYATPHDAPNPNLAWETNKKFNAGFDINILKRFNLSFEYFYDNIQDMISTRNVPEETGYSNVQINSSSMYNKGVEMALKIKLIKSQKIKWNVNFNIATLENKVTSVIGFGDTYSTSSKALALKENQSTSAIWGVKYAGVDPATGRELYEKDGEIYDIVNYKQSFDDTDWIIIGNRQPDFYGGFCTKLSYKRISLRITGRYKYGAEKLVDDDLITKYNITMNRNLSVNAIDYWKKPGDLAINPAVTNNPILPNSTRYLYNTSHIKINNISLSYFQTLEKAIGFIKSISLNFNVSNVFYLYQQKSPEGRNGISEFMHIYPESRTYSFGLKLSY